MVQLAKAYIFVDAPSHSTVYFYRILFDSIPILHWFSLCFPKGFLLHWFCKIVTLRLISTYLDLTGSNWINLDRTGSNWFGPDWTRSNRIKPDQTGSNCIELDWTGSNWIELDRTGFDGIGLDFLFNLVQTRNRIDCHWYIYLTIKSVTMWQELFSYWIINIDPTWSSLWIRKSWTNFNFFWIILDRTRSNNVFSTHEWIKIQSNPDKWKSACILCFCSTIFVNKFLI